MRVPEPPEKSRLFRIKTAQIQPFADLDLSAEDRAVYDRPEKLKVVCWIPRKLFTRKSAAEMSKRVTRSFRVIVLMEGSVDGGVNAAQQWSSVTPWVFARYSTSWASLLIDAVENGNVNATLSRQ